ncbi:MAG: orotidine-5'-phosphate decarboxylase [Planctomycetota bacterium]
MNDAPSFATRLSQHIQATGSTICVGLDPRPNRLPQPIADSVKAGQPDSIAAAYEKFCIEIIDVAVGRVACVKPQAAFFEQLGPQGMIALGNIISHARKRDLLVILDGKRNDIGSTASAYAAAYLGSSSAWGADSLTVSPYLGRDSLDPFVDASIESNAGIFVLVKTSNPGGGYLQDQQVQGGETVYQRVADLIEELNGPHVDSFGYGPVGAVVGATYPEHIAELRARMPSSYLLIPGFGAQGGDARALSYASDSKGLGYVVNSSRHIIFAHARDGYRDKYGDARWTEAVSAAIDEMQAALDAV